MKFYCEELKENTYESVEDFINDFYVTGSSKMTLFEDGTLQCKGGYSRSIEDLLELCSNHLKREVSLKELLRVLYKRRGNSLILFCTNIKKSVYQHWWLGGNKSLIYSNSSCYGKAREFEYIVDGEYEGKYTLSDLEETLKEVIRDEKNLLKIKNLKNTLSIVELK